MKKPLLSVVVICMHIFSYAQSTIPLDSFYVPGTSWTEVAPKMWRIIRSALRLNRIRPYKWLRLVLRSIYSIKDAIDLRKHFLKRSGKVFFNFLRVRIGGVCIVYGGMGANNVIQVKIVHAWFGRYEMTVWKKLVGIC